MIPPKEKAKKLVEKMYYADVISKPSYSEAKEYALICVAEALDAIMEVCDHPIRIEYWKDVKKEIEKY